MSFLLGLAAGITYGAADFLGGLSSRRAHVVTVVLVSEAIGTALMLAFLPLLPGRDPASASLGWGAAAGISGGAGVVAFYRGLAKGRMGVVAPLTAVVAAVIPVAVGVGLGERPHPAALAGVFIALVAVLLISFSPGPGSASRVVTGMPEALMAAAGFGGFFVFLSQAGDASGLWPLVWSRSASMVLIAPVALALRPSFRLRGSLLATTAGAGVLDVTANVLYLEATRFGLLTLAAVLTSLYPASTVVLARSFLAERLERTQWAGLALAAAGIALIALG